MSAITLREVTMIEVNQVLNIIEGLDHINISTLKLDTDFDDQGMDSLDVIQTLFEIQEAFDIEISEDAIAKENGIVFKKLLTNSTIYKKS